MKKILIGLMLLAPVLAIAKATLQNEDFKSKAQLEAAGGNVTQLLNDSKVYVTANGINKQLSTAITEGDIGAGGGGAGKNYVTNPECKNNLTGITDSNGILTRNTTTPIYGLADCKVDATAGSQNVDWAASNTEALLDGQLCQASGSYKGDASLYTVQVLKGGSGIGSAVTLRNTGTDGGEFVIPFTCSSTSSTAIRLASTGNGAAINLTTMYIGKAGNQSALVNQAYLLGSATWANTSNCVWTASSSTVLTTLGADADCANPTVTGGVTAPGTKIPAVVIANAKAGTYRVVFRGDFYGTGAGSLKVSLTDGTTTTQSGPYYIDASHAEIDVPLIDGEFTYTTDQTNLTIQPKMAAATSVFLQNDGYGTTAHVYYHPPAAQIVSKPSDAPAFGGVTIAAAGTHNATVTAGSFTKATDTDVVSGDKTHVGRASITTTAGDFGFKMPTVPAGYYRFQADGLFEVEYTGSATECAFAVSDDGGSTFKDMIYGYAGSAGTTQDNNAGSATFYYSADQTNKEYVVYAKRTLGGGTCSINAGVTAWSAYLIPIEQGMSKPIIPGSFYSGASNMLKMEQVTFGGSCTGSLAASSCTTSPCTICSQTGSWVTNVTRSGTGAYSVNFAQPFAQAPMCMMNVNTSVAAGYLGSVAGTSTTAATPINTGTTSAAADSAGTIMCIGAK